MPEMPTAPGQEQAAPEQAQAGGPAELIQTVHSGLMKLAQSASKVPNMPEGTAEQLASLAEQFQGIVEGAMTAMQGGGAAPKGGQGNVPMEAGRNPNAKPVM